MKMRMTPLRAVEYLFLSINVMKVSWDLKKSMNCVQSSESDLMTFKKAGIILSTFISSKASFPSSPTFRKVLTRVGHVVSEESRAGERIRGSHSFWLVLSG